MDRAQFGSLTGYSASTIASFEQGRRIPPPKFIDQADEVLGAGGVLSASKEELARAQYPAFFRDAARLEAEAVVLHVDAHQAMPGLFQTEDFGRAGFPITPTPAAMGHPTKRWAFEYPCMAPAGRATDSISP